MMFRGTEDSDMSHSGKGKRTPGVNMSLPPDERGRRGKAKRVGGTPSAQMDHASSPRARKKAQQGEKAMRRGRGG
jgi:hypothetical protein